jgi:serine/threonine protein kinase
MPIQANQPLPDGYQLQDYRIASVLSCGGFSIVYLAFDANDQPVAIKEYLPSHLVLRREGDALPAIAEDQLATFRYGPGASSRKAVRSRGCPIPTWCGC